MDQKSALWGRAQNKLLQQMRIWLKGCELWEAKNTKLGAFKANKY
jgi:hypothetical protein